MSTTNQWNGREGYSPKWIILHGTAGGYDAVGIANYFISTEGSNEPVSSNYIVGDDGTTVSFVPENCAAYANGILEDGHDIWWTEAINPNFQTISIENCNISTTNADVLTPTQKAALFPLIKDICNRNGIPKRKANASGGITGHFSISPGSRQDCPGLNFLWNELFSYLNEGSAPVSQVPAGWHDDGKTLYRPDKLFKVVLGFRDHILNADPPWPSANWPIEDEVGVAQLEESNASLGAGSRQLFRMGQLEYTPKRGVFEGWIGNELNALRIEKAALQKQLAAVKK